MSSSIVKGEVVFVTEELGWFVHLEGSWESLFLGEDEPNLVVGDTIEVRIRRI